MHLSSSYGWNFSSRKSSRLMGTSCLLCLTGGKYISHSSLPACRLGRSTVPPMVSFGVEWLDGLTLPSQPQLCRLGQMDLLNVRLLPWTGGELVPDVLCTAHQVGRAPRDDYISGIILDLGEFTHMHMWTDSEHPGSRQSHSEGEINSTAE